MNKQQLSKSSEPYYRPKTSEPLVTSNVEQQRRNVINEFEEQAKIINELKSKLLPVIHETNNILDEEKPLPMEVLSPLASDLREIFNLVKKYNRELVNLKNQIDL